ncbi:hypothetical protein Salat_2942800 [Sesamum alatum]|uniref:Uncharacterized protein n=1 Tax=Sesamum alatum TaxID=300844 RepID=A0AAE2C8J6_9LAMI|nr:hypothetical protein Salat_2942800 [Sesamum alatum]
MHLYLFATSLRWKCKPVMLWAYDLTVMNGFQPKHHRQPKLFLLLLIDKDGFDSNLGLVLPSEFHSNLSITPPHHPSYLLDNIITSTPEHFHLSIDAISGDLSP